MKVALVSEWLDAWRGGAETSTLQFLHHLMDAGIEVHVFTRSRPSPTPGLHVHSVSGAAMSRTRRSVTFAHRVERMVRADRFDIIHAISPCRGATIYQPRGGTVAETIERNIALRPSQARKTFKRYANLFNLKQRHMLRLERELLGVEEGPVVVAISDYVVDQLRRHYRLNASRIRKIYNAVDPDTTPPQTRRDHRRSIREEYGIAADNLLVLTVAHNFKLKGVRHWLEAMALLRSRQVGGVQALVVGQGDTAGWRRRALKLGVSDKVQFIGPSDRVRQLYHAGDVLVHPTYYDPCSRVVLEAMSSGLAVVTTRWDGASEMIRDGISGYCLSEPDDVVGLADRITGLCDASLRSRIQQSAVLITPQVSMSRHTKELIQLYGSLSKHSISGP